MTARRTSYRTNVFVGSTTAPLIQLARQFGGDFYRPRDIMLATEKLYRASHFSGYPYFLGMSKSGEIESPPAEYNLIVSVNSTNGQTIQNVRARFIKRTDVQIVPWESIPEFLLECARSGEILLQECLSAGTERFFRERGMQKVVLS